MENTSFKYEIISADSNGVPTVLFIGDSGNARTITGQRAISAGESIDNYMMAISPFNVTPSPPIPLKPNEIIGMKGTVTLTPVITEQSSKAAIDKAIMQQSVKLEKDIARILIKFGLLTSDPTEIPVTNL